jgi:hypothetical protein
MWLRVLLWYSGKSSWLQIQRSGFDSRRYQIFWEVVGLERGPLSLVSTTEELLDRKISSSGLENLDYGRRGSATRRLRDNPLSAKVFTNFVDKWRSLGRYSTLADSGHRVCFSVFCFVMWLRYRLCGLVVRVLDYRSRGPGLDSRALQEK